MSEKKESQHLTESTKPYKPDKLSFEKYVEWRLTHTRGTYAEFREWLKEQEVKNVSQI